VKKETWEKAIGDETVCSQHKDWQERKTQLKPGCIGCSLSSALNMKRKEIIKAALADGVDLKKP
jgi:hypothetical protein